MINRFMRYGWIENEDYTFPVETSKGHECHRSSLRSKESVVVKKGGSVRVQFI